MTDDQKPAAPARKNCPNCLDEMEKTESGYYCAACDLSFTPAKGRAKPEPGGKGKIQELEEEIMILKRDQDKIVADLYGKHEPFWMK